MFTAVEKYNGVAEVPISDSQMKQIGGRAGRFGTQWDTGLVTTLYNEHLPIVKQAMLSEVVDLKVILK
jgi:ATP-dependent RNA helicase SUPV3L1/SUV3